VISHQTHPRRTQTLYCVYVTHFTKMSTKANTTPIFPTSEQFDGQNFIAFKRRIIIAARATGARAYLDGTPSPVPKPQPLLSGALPPEPTEWTSTSPSPNEWEVRDAWVLSLIIFNTINPVGLGVKMDGTAAEAWTSITDLTMYSDGADFLAHVADLRTKWNTAVEKGAEIDDKGFRAIVIGSLPKSWNTVISSLQSTKTSAAAGPATTALKASSNLSSKPKLVCINTNCGRTSHTIENCYSSSNTSSTPVAAVANTTAQNTSRVTYALSALTSSSMHAQFTPTAFFDLADAYLSQNPTAMITSGQVQTYADSAASDHCFIERSNFSEYESLTVPCRGQPADKGGAFRIVG